MGWALVLLPSSGKASFTIENLIAESRSRVWLRMGPALESRVESSLALARYRQIEVIVRPGGLYCRICDDLDQTSGGIGVIDEFYFIIKSAKLYKIADRKIQSKIRNYFRWGGASPYVFAANQLVDRSPKINQAQKTKFKPKPPSFLPKKKERAPVYSYKLNSRRRPKGMPRRLPAEVKWKRPQTEAR